MIYTETVLLPKDEIVRLQGILDKTLPWPAVYPDRYETFTAVSVSFGDDWEMDVNICACEEKPYVDVTLYQSGCEVYGWDISDLIMGEWQVVLGDDIGRAFKLEIRQEEE